MGPAYYVIAIFGCADASAACAPAATMPAHYVSREACEAQVGAALAANTDLDFPTLEAECRQMNRPAAAKSDKSDKSRRVPATARRA